jgi:hypothetical protein
MAAITRQDVANIINSYLRNRLEGRVSYGSNNYPSDFADPNYGGNTGTVVGAFDASVLPAGPVKAEAVVANIASYVRNWGRVRSIQFLSYYNSKGSLSVRQNVTGITRLSSSVALTRTQAAVSNSNSTSGAWSVGDYVDPYLNGIDTRQASPMAAGQNASRAEVINYCERVYNHIVNLSNSTLRITKNFCHSNCHSDCHSNRGRR